jgi:capsular polysaccharide biosynthesis protein
LQIWEYWRIVRRRLWLVVLLPAVALVTSAYLAVSGPTAYCSNMKLGVSVIPVTGYGPNPQYDPQYYAILSSEYLADDLTEILRSNPFAQDVSAELGYSLDPGLIAGATRTRKTHRTIDLSVCGQDRDAVAAAGGAYERAINTRLPEYFTQLQVQNAQVRVLNRPTLVRANTLANIAAEVGLRTALGLALGLGLAFLLDYLDDRLRDRRELERLLAFPTLAEIPRHEPTLVEGPSPRPTPTSGGVPSRAVR